MAPRPVFDPAKVLIDLDTLKAVIGNRFQVLSRYGREVVMPVLRQEITEADNSCRSVLRRTRKALVRDESLVDEESKRYLSKVLECSQTLDLVYQYRLRLQSVWKRSAATHKERLEALQEWCAQAEATGVQSLERFAKRLSGYSLRPS
jgi:stearoyl-CoA desaturase (delta-9 desaturase)